MVDTLRIEELKRRVQLDPASIAFAALAEEYRRAGRFEDAIATCETGLQRHPAYLSARVTLGRALIEVGRYEEARAELERVLRTAPENLAAIRGLAEIHNRGGELPESYAALEPEPVPPDVSPLPTASAAPAAVQPPPLRVVVSQMPEPAAAPASVEPAPYPDECALPALESLLAAIVAARASTAHSHSR